MTAASVLLEAIAQRLAAAGVGTWSPTGAYTTGQTGITISTMPQAPDRAIVLTLYDRVEHEDPDLTDELVRLQVRVRTAKGRPDAADTLAETVHAALRAHHVVWSGVPITRVHRRSYLPLGLDSNGRPEVSMNYEVLLP